MYTNPQTGQTALPGYTSSLGEILNTKKRIKSSNSEEERNAERNAGDAA
jgi:hypothetical protein